MHCRHGPYAILTTQVCGYVQVVYEFMIYDIRGPELIKFTSKLRTFQRQQSPLLMVFGYWRSQSSTTLALEPVCAVSFGYLEQLSESCDKVY